MRRLMVLPIPSDMVAHYRLVPAEADANHHLDKPAALAVPGPLWLPVFAEAARIPHQATALPPPHFEPEQDQ